jgi:hypothetical protein
LPTDKLGVFADSLSDLSKCDANSVLFTCTMDPLGRAARSSQTMQERTITVPGSYTKSGDYYYKPFSHLLLTVQPYATETIQVNAWTVTNIGATVTLTPKEDVWTDTNTVNVKHDDVVVTLPAKQVTNTTVVTRTTCQNWYNGYHNWYYYYYYGYWYSQWTWINGRYVYLYYGSWIYDYNDGRYYSREEWGQKYGTTVSTTETTSTENKEVGNTTELKSSMTMTPIPNARQIDVTIDGKDFIGSETDIICEFDGNRVPLTPVAPTVSGTITGSVQADALGAFKATFTIPANTKTGVHKVYLESKDPETLGTIAETEFSSYGQLKTITNEYTTIRTIQPIVTRSVTETRTTSIYNPWGWYGVDPLAQTFVFTKSLYLSKINIYFSQKPVLPEDIKDVEILIVTAVNGIPTNEVLGEARLPCSSVNIGSLNNPVATEFTFSNPVFIKKDTDYAFILRTDSSKYNVMISKVGDKDPVNGLVIRQPHSGVLLTSANMKTWTPMQNADMKFDMYSANFQDTPYTINFPVINFTTPISRFELDDNARSQEGDAVIIWEYSTDNSNWRMFVPPVETDIGAPKSQLYIRAIFMGDNVLSAFMKESHAVKGFLWDPSGTYLTKTIDLRTPSARYIDLYMDVNIKSGTSVVPTVELDNDEVWRALTHVPADDHVLDLDWTEKHYTFDTGSNSDLKQFVQIKVDLGTTDSTVSPAISRVRVIGRAI